ncbi:hypothetical protein TVAG_511380 [Trichomonas vaginalis G3]|uniref:Uncharacterized protein n=1 Tax=Trichomonas vaginalis (strain ATCC PRA-98 / G3) TaxID=412133 RepID=A2GP43_TRIV3|nr:hypothetical protein TVAGG3_0827660 [Trichomonas vaginalis G3]EAX81074.1 hypothetical protein TVAG_511380 [Trichomonas vaginalis G3]KAI5498358.1 hypothetical protein TVAGG3_0827660 [Trichomonas vaginalis G3]|eukprot:XP_001294004.1 hypothetical protein [Trichomonas vaginalis G3]
MLYSLFVHLQTTRGTPQTPLSLKHQSMLKHPLQHLLQCDQAKTEMKRLRMMSLNSSKRTIQIAELQKNKLFNISHTYTRQKKLRKQLKQQTLMVKSTLQAKIIVIILAKF